MSHHRDHAREHLVQASHNIAQAQQQLGLFIKVHQDIVFTQELGNIVTFLGQTADKITQATALLSSGDLDTIRRLINQPNKNEPLSALQWASLTSTQMLTMLRKGAQPSDVLSIAASYNGVTWERLDMALWHINDAIREEIYKDPIFTEM